MIRVDCVDSGNCRRILKFEALARKRFVEEPDASRDCAGWISKHDLDQRGLGGPVENPFQDQEIDAFVPQRKGQMTQQRRLRLIPLVVDFPEILGSFVAASGFRWM